MKRLFYESRIYDYTKIKEADKHIEQMKEKGWHPVVKDEDYQECVYNNGQTEYPYSVEFYRER